MTIYISYINIHVLIYINLTRNTLVLAPFKNKPCQWGSHKCTRWRFTQKNKHDGGSYSQQRNSQANIYAYKISFKSSQQTIWWQADRKAMCCPSSRLCVDLLIYWKWWKSLYVDQPPLSNLILHLDGRFLKNKSYWSPQFNNRC